MGRLRIKNKSFKKITMQKILDFFNKIMGLVVFLLAITVLVAFFHHGHHWKNGPHRHFKNGERYEDSTKSVKDSLYKR